MSQLDGNESIFSQLSDRLLRKKRTETIGDGSPYRTAVIEHVEPTFFANIIDNSRARIAAIGVMIAAGGLAVDRNINSSDNEIQDTPKAHMNHENELETTYTIICTVKKDITAEPCAPPKSMECLIDLRRGPKKLGTPNNRPDVVQTGYRRKR